jgi:ubiquinone/menaquinone biosynthesis C-methylase UbiE
MSNNKRVFSTVECSNWADKQVLLPEERTLIEAYFKKGDSTVEAGTAGGRILLEMKKLGFQSLFGFDYVPEFIEIGNRRDDSKSITFSVQDATGLDYADASFHQAIYLQQIICFIEDEAKRFAGIKEAYRILKPGGVALFSFLSFDAKKMKPETWFFLYYLTLLRKITGRSTIPLQYLPWLQIDSKVNWGAFIDRPPYNYWFYAEEAEGLLRRAGFEVVQIGYPHQILKGIIRRTAAELANDVKRGIIYFVVRKPPL